MLAFRKYLLAGVASVGLTVAGATSGLAGPLELNPIAQNGVNGPLDLTGCTGTCGGDYPFFTNNSTTFFTSDLTVQGTPGTSGSQLAKETGSVLIANFVVVPPSSAGATPNVVARYNVYATFTISGQGTWGNIAGVNTNTFTINPAGVTASINLIGSPGSATTSGLSFQTPGPNQTGVLNPGAGSFSLGIASLTSALFAPFAAGNQACFNTGGTSCSASTQFEGEFSFNPAAGVFGPNGFLENITGPLQLTIDGNAGGNGGNTTETIGASTTNFVTAVGPACGAVGFNNPCGRGGGSLTYDVQVPEPASLALLGGGLIAFGFFGGLRRRRNQKLSA